MKVDGMENVLVQFGWKEGRKNIGEIEREGEESNFSITGNTIKKIGESWPRDPEPSPTSRFLFGRSLFAFQSANRVARTQGISSTLLTSWFSFLNRSFAPPFSANKLSNDPRKVFKWFK